MKTVHNTDMVAHLWAHQSQARARNASSSTSFDGPTFYSYRTPIAKLHETRRGRVALICSTRFSMTTSSRHMPAVWRALRGLDVRAFSVPFVGDERHTANVTYLAVEYTELAGRILRARYLYGADAESYASIFASLDGAAQRARDYCDVFGLKAPVIDVADDARVIIGKRQARAARAADPKVVAARERAKAAAERRKEQREIAKRVAERERTKNYVAEFRAGQYRYCLDENGGALLRFDAADDMVRTSRGAEIPAEHARRAFPLINRARLSGQTWAPPENHTVHLGAFKLNSIAANGTLRAGCHTIHWPEIEACARAMGLLVG